MMQDLISRQAAIECVYKALRMPPLKGTFTDTMSLAISMVNDLPSAQPFTSEQIQTMQELESAQVEKAYELGKADRPTAHWKDGKWCSNCGEGIPTDVWDGGVEKDEIKFCFSCGARIEG